ncbi:MAG: 4-alpha-glucanotransferase [Actinomycetota bacterium]
MKGLRELARLWGVQTSYHDAGGVRQHASPETVRAILGALDVPAVSARDVAGAIRDRRAALWGRLLEPVTASWEGTPAVVTVRVRRATDVLRVTMLAEDGEERSWEVDVRALDPIDETDDHVAVSIQVPGPVRVGYSIVRVGEDETMLVRAPRRVAGWSRRSWGVFIPLYALRTSRDWGAGDLEDVAALLRWVAARGGDVVATLPLFARFPGVPSPYEPISRLFWDEMWIASDERPEGLAPSNERADHDRVRALKRRAIEARAPEPGPVDDQLDAYARFRAACERHGATWPRWPARAMVDVDPSAWRFHVAAQRLAREQLNALASEKAAVLFDLPLGVHAMGFDAWRYRSSFAHGTHGGAPPDGFFTKGQDWEFPPLHPERIRDDRYRYPIACLREVMSRARVLRIDHVMGFHRMWWIPAGAAPTEGAYVRYRPEEQYAILALESHRSGCAVVGEDLGTVPAEVRRTMGRRGVMRTYALQDSIGARGLDRIPTNAVASLNTHDMPTFAAFWRGLDVDRRRDLGLLDDVEAGDERAARARTRTTLARALGVDADAGERELLQGALRALGRSRARVVVAAMEDLWGETEQQNTPGTGRGFGNWERRARYSLEEVPEDAVALLREIEEAR